MTNEVEYHVDFDGDLILDENDQPIPKTICLCFARSLYECVCGAWDDVPTYE